MIAGRADLRAGLLGERAQPVWFARLGFQVVAQASGGGHLGLPRDIEREAVLAEQLLLGLTLVGAGDIGGRDRDKVRGRSGFYDGGRHPGRAEKVDLDGLGQWSIEGDGGGRVDDHVRRRQRAAPLLVEPEAVAAHIAGDGVDPSRHLLVEAVSKLRAQAVEAVVLDHLAGESGGGVRPAPGPHEHGHLGIGDAAEDALDQGGAEKPRGTGDEEAFPTENPLNGHRKCLPLLVDSVYHLVSAQLDDEGPHP